MITPRFDFDEYDTQPLDFDEPRAVSIANAVIVCVLAFAVGAAASLAAFLLW